MGRRGARRLARPSRSASSATAPRCCPSCCARMARPTSSPTRRARTTRSAATCPSGSRSPRRLRCASASPTSTCGDPRRRWPLTSRRSSASPAGGAVAFDYGNNLRAGAEAGGLAHDVAFSYPGFVPAFVRPLFCEGKGPFRWAALSGDPADIAATDAAVAELFPDNERLQRWLRLASREGGVPGTAGADLLARLRRARPGRRALQRARGERRGERADRDRPRSPRRRKRREPESRDRGDARRLRRDRGLADPQRAGQHGRRRPLGERAPRRRRRHRLLDPRRHGRGGRRLGERRRATAARAHVRSRHGRRAPRRRRLRPRDRGRGRARRAHADARRARERVVTSWRWAAGSGPTTRSTGSSSSSPAPHGRRCCTCRPPSGDADRAVAAFFRSFPAHSFEPTRPRAVPSHGARICARSCSPRTSCS